jgi:hypothetical protein
VSFKLNGGLLADTGVTVTGDDFGSATLEQNGGTHVITNGLSISGGFTHGETIRPGTYILNGGTLSAQVINLYGTSGDAVFLQTNGIVRAGVFQANSAGYYSSCNTLVTLAGGTLNCSNYTTVDGGARFNQTGGALVVSNLLDFGGGRYVGGPIGIIYGLYTLTAGTLTAKDIRITGDWIIGDGTTNRITNSGTFSLAHALMISNAVEQLGAFILPSNAVINLAGSASRLSFANSSGQAWASGSTLTISYWNGSLSGGGAEQLKFGTSASGLTSAQLSQIAFSNPAGLPSGTYPAKILSTGEVVPDGSSPPPPPGLVNNWINPGSDKWEHASSWSLGSLPASNETVNITNAGYKAVNIDSTTVFGYTASLTVSNFQVSAPGNALSTLLLNYAGTGVPLHVLNAGNIGANASLQNFYSSLQVDGAAGGNLVITNGGQFIQEGGLTVVTPTVQLRNGTLNATNATMNLGPLEVGSAYTQTGAVTQLGGTILSSAVTINSGTYSLLTNGTLFALNGTYLTNQGNFIQASGTNYGDVRLGYSTSYRMTGGLVRGTNIYTVTFGNFHQDGGTVEVQNLSVQGNSIYPLFPSYVMTTGLLHCATLNITGNNGGFAQSGGTLFLTNRLNLFDPSGAADTFELTGGYTFMPSLVVSNNGDYLQYGGTNQVAGDISLFNDGLAIYGGRLSSVNLGIAETGRGYQEGGTNEISGVLSIVGGYTVVKGVLSVGGIYTRGNLVISFLNSDGTATPAVLNNTGLINFGGALYVSSSQNSMGQLGLSANGACYLGSSPLNLRFANSSALNWDLSSTLTIQGWNGSYSGNGSHQIYFGSSATGLTSQQLARIKFSIAGELYPARILATGEVVPAGGPTLQAARNGSALVLTWSGNYQLLSATNVAGPYTPVPGATSPWTNQFTKPQEFFILRGQ